jgi:Mg2+/citrate symporter
MVVLGLLLLLAAGALTVEVVIANTDTTHVSVFGQAISGLTLGGLFVAGVITGAIAILALAMMLAGARRRRTRRVGLRRQVLDEREEKESLAEENALLRRQLEDTRSTSGIYPDDPVETDTTARHGLFNR